MTEVFEERLSKIKEKIERLHSITPIYSGRAYNAAYRYCFPINPVATQDQILAFEREHNCSLPIDYREFIQQVGDGGLGDQGINALFKENNKTGYPHQTAKLAPFPFIWQMSTEEETGEEYGLSFAYWEDVKNKAESFDLAARILCEGCDCYFYLVLTGEEKGTMWRVWVESEGVFSYGQTGECKRISFLDWLENWLERTLRNAEQAQQSD